MEIFSFFSIHTYKIKIIMSLGYLSVYHLIMFIVNRGGN